jgi:hypothetical protein
MRCGKTISGPFNPDEHGDSMMGMRNFGQSNVFVVVKADAGNFAWAIQLELDLVVRQWAGIALSVDRLDQDVAEIIA